MPFTSDTQVTVDLQNLLSQPSGLTATYWTAIIARANNAAYWEIVNRLLGRGYTLAQVLTFDRGAEYQRDIALYFCLIAGKTANPEGYSAEFVKVADRRTELDSVLVTALGVPLTPAGSFGLVGTGPFDTSGDLFGLDPNDVRIGQTTRM